MQLTNDQITMTLEEFIRYHASAKVRLEVFRAKHQQLKKAVTKLPEFGPDFVSSLERNQDLLADQVAEGDRLITEFLGNEVAL